MDLIKKCMFTLSLLVTVSSWAGAPGGLCDLWLGTIQKPFLFSVTKGGKTSFLFGTIHVGVGLDEFPAYLGAAISRSQRVVFESETPSKLVSTFNSIRLYSSMINLTGPKLSQQLSKESWETLSDTLTWKGVPMALAERLTPSGASILLGFDFSIDLDKTLDHEIRTLAQRNKQFVGGLEKQSVGIKLLGSLVTLEDLEKEIKALKPAKKYQGLARYRAGDLTAFETELETRAVTEPNVTRRMIFDRTQSWLPRLTKLISESGQNFVVVGIDHLAGEQGLLSALTARGFTVHRIISEAEFFKFVIQHPEFRSYGDFDLSR